MLKFIINVCLLQLPEQEDDRCGDLSRDVEQRGHACQRRTDLHLVLDQVSFLRPSIHHLEGVEDEGGDDEEAGDEEDQFWSVFRHGSGSGDFWPKNIE